MSLLLRSKVRQRWTLRHDSKAVRPGGMHKRFCYHPSSFRSNVIVSKIEMRKRSALREHTCKNLHSFTPDRVVA
jgi:hypothetical protein